MAEYIIGKTGAPGTLTGHGYDVHRLVEGRKLILCGVEVPNKDNLGLLGHSDADAAHAPHGCYVVELSGTGRYRTAFPDSDSRYKGISSMKLLEHVVKMLEKTPAASFNAI